MTKKKGLTLEERIEQALVPEEEWPYELPDGWKWVKISSINSNMISVDPKKVFKESFRYVDIDAIDNKGHKLREYKITRILDAPSRAKRKLKKNNIVYSLVRPYLENVAVIEDDLNDIIGSTGFYVFDAINGINVRYLYYYLLSDEFTKKVMEHMKGDNSPSIKKSNFEHLPFPYTSTKRQKEIADMIDNQFEKLDRAKELIQNAIDSFEDRKAAILQKAYTGELTKKWREENGCGLDSWEERKLIDCGEWNGGGTPTKSKKEFWESGTVMWVSPKDMKSLYITETIDYITEMAVENSSTKFIPKHSILFVVRSGILRRTFRIAICEDDCTINQDMKALSVSQNINPLFLMWILIGQEKKLLSECSKSGTTVESISMEKLYDYDVMIPKRNEQDEIVKSIDKLINFENEAMELMDVIDNIDRLKKTILSKAFRGLLNK